MLNELLNKSVLIECRDEYEYEGVIIAFDDTYDLVKLVTDGDETVYINLKYVIGITVNDDEEDDGEDRLRGLFGRK